MMLSINEMKQKFSLQRTMLYFLILTFLSGCAGWNHGYNTRKYQGRLIKGSSSEGVARIQEESDYDSTVKNYISVNGAPEYILVEDASHLYFVLPLKNEIIEFSRGISSISQTKKVSPIPDSVMSILPETKNKPLESSISNPNKVPTTEQRIPPQKNKEEIKKNREEIHGTRKGDDLIERAKRYIKNRMKDPSSVIFSNVYINEAYAIESGHLPVCGLYNAKNSYGGYTGEEIFYYFESDDGRIYNSFEYSLETYSPDDLFKFCNKSNADF